MVKIQFYENNENNPNKATRLEMTCYSTDEKPIGSFQGIILEDGMLIYELDTDKSYIYLEKTNTWKVLGG